VRSAKLTPATRSGALGVEIPGLAGDERRNLAQGATTSPVRGVDGSSGKST
jgi:hypothetical protein